MKASWIASLFFLFATTASADILFIDTNNSPEEIAAAKKGADARGEKLVVVPTRTPEQQKVLDQIHQYELQIAVATKEGTVAWREMDQFRTQLQNEQQKGHPNQARVNQLNALIDAAYAKMQKADEAAQSKIDPIIAKEKTLIHKVNLSVSSDEIRQVVKSHHDQKKPFSTIVFSGHHDSAAFSGILGSISKDDVVNTFKTWPDMAGGVKSGLGLGCYSATPAENEWWRKSFPKIQLIAGFDAGGPAASQPANRAFIEDFLTKDASIRKVGENKQTEHNLHLISGMVHDLNGFDGMNTAVCTKDIYIGRNTGEFDVTKATTLCTQKDLDALQKVYPRVTTMVLSAESKENPPCDGQHSWLRDYYNSLRGHQHCANPVEKLGYDYIPLVDDADAVIRLIDFQEVYENFKIYYKNQLAGMTSKLKACGVAPLNTQLKVACTNEPPRPKQPGEVNRGDILKYLDLVTKNPACTKDPVIAKGFAQMNGLLRNLNCIPLSWVNPVPLGKTVDPPTCDPGAN